MSIRTIAVVKAVFAVVTWGASFVATKVALRYVSPITVVWVRFAIGVIVIGIIVFFRGQFAFPSKGDIAYFALVGFVGITFHQWLQSTGLLTAQASTTSWIVATTPVFMALLAWIFLKEKFYFQQWLGIVLAACGVLLVVSKGNLSAIAIGQFGTTGDFLILISALNWAFFSTLSKRGLEKHPATRMLFFVMFFGWLFTSLLFITGKGYLELQEIAWGGWLGLVFLGLFCSGLAYIFWFDALKTLQMAQAGAFVYLEPFVTLIVAVIILGEVITTASLIGGGAILAGVLLVNRVNRAGY